MTPVRFIRPVLAMAVLSLLGGCGGADGEPFRFEELARSVAEIPVSLDRDRPAPAPVRIEVMEPMDLWAARDGLTPQNAQATVRNAVTDAVVDVARNTAGTVAQNLARQATDRAVRRAGGETVAPPRASATLDAPGVSPVSAPAAVRLVQIGAYSSPAAAQAAWAELSGRAGFTGLTPRYETVEVAGRALVRLKVAAPVAEAARLCAAAGVRDAWCSRQG